MGIDTEANVEECKVEVKKVLAALDFSQYSETTFVHALTLARALGAELILLNVLNSRGLDFIEGLAAQGYDISRRALVEKHTNAARKTLENDYISRAGGVQVRALIKEGLPWDVILTTLKNESVDMVVMGTKGHGNLAGVLFGSTAEKVHRHSPCTVVSVRGPEHCRIPG
jgi:nucleotide-binding universal stress UspA family protein